MAATAPPNHARSTLRWKLFALVAVIAVGSAAATLALDYLCLRASGRAVVKEST